MVKTESKTILFVVQMSTFFTEQIGIIKLCLEHGIKPIVHFAVDLEYVIFHLQTCFELGLEVYDTNGELIREMPSFDYENNFEKKQTKGVKKNAEGFLKKIYKKFKKIYYSPIINWHFLHKKFQLRRKVINELYKRLKPDFVLLGGDLVGHDSCITINEAKKYGIKSIVLTPILADGDDPANAFVYIDIYQTKNIINFIASKLFPDWTYCYEGKNVLRVPASYILLYKLLKLDPPKPWVFNSGFSDYIIVEGKEACDFYVRAGIEKEKIKIIGNINHDILYEKFKNKEKYKKELYEKYSFNKNKKLIVATIHPDFMSGVSEFSSYEELNEYWFKVLAETSNYNVICCPHPGVDINQYKKYERDNLKIYESYTIEVAGLADIFITGYSSSMKWAIMCGIPVLNFDITNVKCNYYNDTKGVLCVNTKKDFETELKNLSLNENYYLEISEKQRQKSNDWGVLDGNVKKRMLEILLVTESKNKI